MAAGGRAAEREAERMVTEKGEAMAKAATILAAGGSPEAVVRHYRTRVRANERRLSKSKRPRKTKR